ncbi:putative DNA breaking-rejoining enzyme [Lyophyllum shimeji]|uniref:DNA breaking-rejoining enzyme n=1 Tax=Lyophyllum shimeji TaxID=47721 RepID=A0A9P3PWY6_LYOSH|nr:putative DNA breaking-rejoining enzyme [Lyophyllum shimeji]
MEYNVESPFSFEEVERILRGPIHSSPFLVSEQIAGPGLPPKYRVCRNLSKADPVSGMPAINSFIDKDDFPTSFDMALKVAAAVAEAPPGTQGIAFDIKTFHRTCPVLPDHKPYLVASFQGKFYIDHVHPFGARPASSNAGQIGNAAVDIWQAESRSENRLFKYEDDIQNFRYPNQLGRFSDGVFTYFHNRETSLALIDILHIPWHPEKSGICFAFTTTFIGFQWDLTLHRVSLPEKKRMNLSNSILDTLYWWQKRLEDRTAFRQLRPIGPVHHYKVFVDASTSWGIGIIIGPLWHSFRLAPGWKRPGRDICWLETLAIELAILFLKQLNFYGQRVEVFSDNSGAIGAHSKNRSPNITINLSVRRSYSVLAECLIVPDFIYIESASNPADPISRGDLAPPSLRFLTQSFDMPRELADIFLHEGVHLATSPSTQTASPPPTSPHASPPPSDIILSPSSHSALDLFCPIQPSPDISENLHVIRSLATRSLPPCSPRKPRPADAWRPSPLRPIVPADRRVLLWTTPHSEQAQQSLDSTISPRLQRKIFENLLLATSDSTRQSYGAGLLHFTQFCDREEISENLRMPASTILLSAFIADAIGTCTGNCIRNWLNGLRLWHLYNLADWHGRDRWVSSLQKAADIQGVPFKRPPRGPITKDHLRHLHSNLNFATPAHAAIWAAALAAFWGCRRLGELLLRSRSSFSPTRNVT